MVSSGRRETGRMRMNIGLIAVDSNCPNLALMKLSAWHKSQGECGCPRAERIGGYGKAYRSAGGYPARASRASMQTRYCSRK